MLLDIGALPVQAHHNGAHLWCKGRVGDVCYWAKVLCLKGCKGIFGSLFQLGIKFALLYVKLQQTIKTCGGAQLWTKY